MIHSITILGSNIFELTRQSEILLLKGFTPFDEPWAFGEVWCWTWVCDLGTPTIAAQTQI